jgi:hypothetical protein
LRVRNSRSKVIFDKQIKLLQKSTTIKVKDSSDQIMELELVKEKGQVSLQ